MGPFRIQREENCVAEAARRRHSELGLHAGQSDQEWGVRLERYRGLDGSGYQKAGETLTGSRSKDGAPWKALNIDADEDEDQQADKDGSTQQLYTKSSGVAQINSRHSAQYS